MKRLALTACLLLAAAAANAHVHPIRLDGAAGPAADGSLPPDVICTTAGPVAATAAASSGDEAQRWLALGPFLLLVGAGALRAWRRQRPPR